MEPVQKATYWDKSIPTEERRAKAKRQTLSEPEEETKANVKSEGDKDEDDEPIYKTIVKSAQRTPTAKLCSKAVGTRVARKFGRRGVFTVEIVEYSTDDDLYRVEYTNTSRR